jgi:hypothetical protein
MKKKLSRHVSSKVMKLSDILDYYSPKANLLETRGLAAKADTEKLVSDGTKTIFQATVITEDGLLAMADIITRDNASESWTLYG